MTNDSALERLLKSCLHITDVQVHALIAIIRRQNEALKNIAPDGPRPTHETIAVVARSALKETEAIARGVVDG